MLRKVKGLGKKTEILLEKNGIHTIADLATITIAKLAMLKGITTKQADILITNAKLALPHEQRVALKIEKPEPKAKKPKEEKTLSVPNTPEPLGKNLASKLIKDNEPFLIDGINYSEEYFENKVSNFQLGVQ